MHQFFVEKSQVGKEYVTITGSDVNHIRNVLRMKIGETIRISDREGGNYFCKIAETGENFVQADIVSVDEEGTELPSKIYLFQALPKGDRMETVIEKAVELGVYEIIPVAMKYCVVKLEGKKAAQRVQKWQAQAETAAKQSKRSIIPKIHEVVSFKEALKLAENCDIRLVPYENENGMEGTRTVLEQIEPVNAGKGAGIEKMLKHYGIDKSQAMAFGDGNNDIEMLKAVGNGIAMANASDDLKAVADEICGDVSEDGIYHYCLEKRLI